MPRKLGDILTSRNLVTVEQLYEGLRHQMIANVRIGTSLVQLGHLQVDDLGRCLSIQFGVPHADAELLDGATKRALDGVPPDMCERYMIIPMRLEEEVLNLAMAKPSRSIAGELSFALGLTINRFVAPELRIVYFLEHYYHVLRPPRFLRSPDGKKKEEDRRKYLSATIKAARDPSASSEQSWAQGVNLIALGDDDEELLTIDEPAPADADEGAARSIPELSLNGPEPAAEAPLLHPGAAAGRAAASSRSLRLASSPEELLQPPDDEEEEEEPDERSPTSVYKMVRAERRVDVLKEKIAQASDTDEVDRLLVEPFLDHTALSVLFWMRDRFAIGSRGFGTPAAVQQPQKLVVTLEAPSMMRYAMQTRGIIRGVGENDDTQIKIAGQLDSKLPGEVCVTPILLKGHVVKLLTIHSYPETNFPDDAPQQVIILASSAAEAYERIAG